MLALASPGIDFIEISQRVALGEQVVFEELVLTDHVGYVIVGQPPLWAHRVVSVPGWTGWLPSAVGRSLAQQADGHRGRLAQGEPRDAYAVLGTAPQPDDVRELQQFIDDEVEIVYE